MSTLDTVSSNSGNYSGINSCGPITYTILHGATQPWLDFDVSTGLISLENHDPSLIGQVVTIYLRAELNDYSNVAHHDFSFDVEFIVNCESATLSLPASNIFAD